MLQPFFPTLRFHQNLLLIKMSLIECLIRHNCFMKQYVISIVLILVAVLIYKLIIVPRKLYYSYLNKLQQLGYKVYATPFSPLGMPFYHIIEKDKKEGDALKICKTAYRDNDVILSNSIHRVVLDFSHPDFIRDFYSNEHLYTYPKLKFSYAPIVRAMGRGIPFSEGEEWKRKRRIINTIFNFDFIKSMTPKIEKVCSQALTDVEKIAGHTTENGAHVVEYDIIDLTVRMFSSVVLECFLGGATEQKLEGVPVCMFINKLISDVVLQGFEFLPMLLGVRFVEAGIRAKDRDVNRRIALFKNWGLKYIKTKIEIARKRIEEKGMKEEPKDMIEALVRANINSKTKSNEDFYTDQEILEEFSTFFVAGTDTTSHFVMTMIYFIAQNPEVESKLRECIQKYMKNDDYSYENLKNLTYIDWIQKETTRLYGPVNGLFMREAIEDNYLNGLPIKKGTILTIQHMGNHYSQKYFKDPLVFRPERWEKQCDEIPSFVTGGFSAGARTCIGKHLVQVEAKIGLIKFMKRYKKITIPDKPLKWVIKFVYSPEYFLSKMTINQ